MTRRPTMPLAALFLRQSLEEKCRRVGGSGSVCIIDLNLLIYFYKFQIS